jgi:hypothetical protein
LADFLFAVWWLLDAVILCALSVRVKTGLKGESERIGVDLRAAVEGLLEELVAERKAKAAQIAKELSSLMDVTPQEWVNDVKATRREMQVPHRHLCALPDANCRHCL